MSGEHRLKEDDIIVQSIETTNKAELLMFSNKQNVYKVKAYELEECKTNSMGQYLNNILPLDSDEAILFMLATTDYSGEIIFAFENGKATRVSVENYKTKLNRKKMINAFSGTSPLIGAVHINGTEDVVFIRDDKKTMLISSELISLKTTRTSQGIQVFTLKRNSKLSKILKAEDFTVNKKTAYKRTKLPSTGASPRDEDNTFFEGLNL